MLIPLPYYWGNPWYRSKAEFLESQISEQLPNTFFFGSSTVYRQIDPSIFNTVVNGLGKEKISSFNLGAPATICPQPYYLYRHFLESNSSKNAKYVFIELANVTLINSTLMHQERTTYWQNYSDYGFVLHAALSNSSLSMVRKIGFFYRYSISLIENQFNIGFFGHLIVKQPDENTEDFLGPNQDGYYPLEAELLVTKNPEILRDLVMRQKSLVSDTMSLVVESEESVQDLTYNNKSLDEIHLKKILQLIEKSNERNIHLIFFVSPRLSSPELIALYDAVPKFNKLEFSNARLYPELYHWNNTYDIAHLNTKGSGLYSQLMAENFWKLINKEVNHDF